LFEEDETEEAAELEDEKKEKEGKLLVKDNEDDPIWEEDPEHEQVDEFPAKQRDDKIDEEQKKPATVELKENETDKDERKENMNMGERKSKDYFREEEECLIGEEQSLEKFFPS